ncbi:FeoB-associated Cys-rich membrane protein [Desulfobacter vibrioformis]|uniref:FeoB-associated Cys-rich membrane protein n=1 Tax=Desulfobacter vibrioformis TaxID=34031 RepID=UPI00054D32CD|nr:FeoB-associated Cys-rich membrane protein [Desulfobacter vibrioformis]
MIENMIVAAAVCGAVFYLYRQWKKIKNADSPSCAGCNACAGSKKNRSNAIFDSMEEAETKEK